MGRGHNLNTFVDSVLSKVYSTLAALQQCTRTGKDLPRRKLVFSSFAPDVCAALNWKQPNCAGYIFPSWSLTQSISRLNQMPFFSHRTVASGTGHPGRMLPALFRWIGPINGVKVSRLQLNLRRSTISWGCSSTQVSWCVESSHCTDSGTDLFFLSFFFFFQEKVPSLTQGVKEAGILLAAFGMRGDADSGILDLDASMHNGTLVF